MKAGATGVWRLRDSRDARARGGELEAARRLRLFPKQCNGLGRGATLGTPLAECELSMSWKGDPMDDRNMNQCIARRRRVAPSGIARAVGFSRLRSWALAGSFCVIWACSDGASGGACSSDADCLFGSCTGYVCGLSGGDGWSWAAEVSCDGLSMSDCQTSRGCRLDSVCIAENCSGPGCRDTCELVSRCVAY